MAQDPGADPIARLVHHLSRLPGVGGKTAVRLAQHLVRDSELSGALAEALAAARTDLVQCSLCGNVGTDDPCRLCTDPKRDDGILCVIERSQDLEAILRSGGYDGRYHILGGALSPLDGIGPSELRVREMLGRLQDGRVREVILATNPTVEGDTTAMYLARLLENVGVRVSRIARGVSVGSELEYTDSSTISKAIEDRREL
ncbi:MAG: recombination protein RecR [Deltaproteobacteria bacterium]|nr:recombination protein RecR [Deltaproteobacteria bacterium]